MKDVRYYFDCYTAYYSTIEEIEEVLTYTHLFDKTLLEEIIELVEEIKNQPPPIYPFVKGE